MSVTLSDLELRNGLYFALFYRIRVGLRCRCRRKTIVRLTLTSVSKSTFHSLWPY